MRRALAVLYLACGWLAGAFLLAIAVLVLAQVAGRLVGELVPLADEFGGFCLGATSFLALAPTLRAGGHVRVSLLLQNLPPRARHWAELWCLGAASVLAVYFTYYLGDMVWESYQFGDVSQGIVPTPLWIPQTGMALGMAAFALALIEQFVDVARGGAPVYAQAQAPAGRAEGA
jgi:TRAP-type C4-dicarboxylate transport system permease small subunit